MRAVHVGWQVERRGPPASLSSVVSHPMTPSPILAHGGAIAPLLLVAYFAGASFVGGIVLMFNRRPGLRWLGLGLLLCGVTTAILVLVFFDAFVRYFADATLHLRG